MKRKTDNFLGSSCISYCNSRIGEKLRCNRVPNSFDSEATITYLFWASVQHLCFPSMSITKDYLRWLIKMERSFGCSSNNARQNPWPLCRSQLLYIPFVTHAKNFILLIKDLLVIQRNCHGCKLSMDFTGMPALKKRGQTWSSENRSLRLWSFCSRCAHRHLLQALTVLGTSAAKSRFQKKFECKGTL